MVAKRNLPISVLMIVAVLLIISSACGGKTAVQTQPTPTERQGQNEPAELPQEENTPLPTNTLFATDTPEPTAQPTPLPMGFSRQNPFPISEVVSAPNLDIQVMEFQCGEEAWKIIHAANKYINAAPAGMEYVLIKLHVKSKYTDSDGHKISTCDFGVTGDQLKRYGCGMAMAAEPEPNFDATLYTGGEGEGWASYLIGQGEKNLMLVYSDMLNFEDNANRYIALEAGASVGVPPELASIQPTDLGTTRNDPAPRSAKLISEDWEISVLDVVRGDEAWSMIKKDNPYSSPPVEGMEYIAVKIHIRYIGTEETAYIVSKDDFRSTGSAGVLYESPVAVYAPDPSLNSALFPGGENEGWVVVQVAKGETGVMLVFKHLWDMSDINQRFISLEK